MGKQSSYQLGCLGEKERVVTLLEVSEREEGVVALLLRTGPLKPLCIGAGTEMRTQYLPAVEAGAFGCKVFSFRCVYVPVILGLFVVRSYNCVYYCVMACRKYKHSLSHLT